MKNKEYSIEQMVRRPQEISVLVLRGPLDEKTELLISSGETVPA